MRIRFAPSPSGHLHVGNARTALFNWLLARRHGGTFVLRIEDTDTERSTAESERSILNDLEWLGLDWDEGPDAGGAFGPYRQSERFDLYRSTTDDLLSRGLAYYCFCSTEQLEADRKAALAAGLAPKYGGRCRTIAAADAMARVRGGEPAAVRFRVAPGGDITFQDVVRGAVTFSRDVIGDPVIVRSDGRPNYNFAVVIDDITMQITHVVRGEDHISNTPRQILIYEALGAPPPTFAHLSLVLGPDHAPLSKRHGATSVAEFRERGFLPEALVNYLALLGWSPGENASGEQEERLPVAEMARRFDLARVSHSAAVFDTGKLAWMNRHYMKEADPARIARTALPYFVRAGILRDSAEAAAYLESALPMVLGSVDTLAEMPERLAAVFGWDASRAAAMIAQEPEAQQAARVVDTFAREISTVGSLDRDAFRAAANRVRQLTGIKGRDLFHPIRDALTAAASGPELDLVIPAIDRAAALPVEATVAAVFSCAARAAKVAEQFAGRNPAASN